MLQAVHVTADLIQIVHVKLGKEDAFLVAHLTDHVTPGIYNHRVTVTLPLDSGHTSLSCCNNVALVFNSSCTKESFPVAGSRFLQESTRYEHYLSALYCQFTIKFRKADIVGYTET